MKRRILIIDDELSCCTFLSLALKNDYYVRYETDAAKGLELLRAEGFHLVLLDMVINGDNGLDVLREIKAYDPFISVIIMTAYGSIRTSVEAMRGGAFTYLSKPVDLDEVRVFVQQALSMQRLNDEIFYLSEELKQIKKYQEMIGASPQMRQVYSLIDRVRDVDSNVIITGESGTGKELAARAVHYSGKRKGERFVVINCAAIPESLLEEELFGHKRGAFTGATSDRKGKLEIADRGTVFFDEIGDMPLGLQSKLLRAIQQKEFTPLGDTAVRKVDIRIISATNRSLADLVEEGRFREDLYYRLNVINIHMPALRDRCEDIPLLCRFFIEKFNHEQNKQVREISPAAAQLLLSYDFPGNVRQLANVLEYAMILSTGSEIRIENLPLEVQAGKARPGPSQSQELADMLGGLALKDIEKLAIGATLEKNNGRRDLSARDLGISVRSLQNKIILYGLQSGSPSEKP